MYQYLPEKGGMILSIYVINIGNGDEKYLKSVVKEAGKVPDLIHDDLKMVKK